MYVYVDASPLIALGTVGRLEVLEILDGDLVIPERVQDEVTSEPARTNLQRFLDEVEFPRHPHSGIPIEESLNEHKMQILDESERNGDTEIIAGVLGHTDTNQSVGVVSDDRRVRTVADGLGATVTGTIGVVVRNVEEDELGSDAAKDLVRRIDSHGLHMTGELRETAYDLIEDAG